MIRQFAWAETKKALDSYWVDNDHVWTCDDTGDAYPVAPIHDGWMLGDAAEIALEHDNTPPDRRKRCTCWRDADEDAERDCIADD